MRHVLAALAVLLAAAPAAGAAELRPAPGASCATTDYTAPEAGLLTADLRGPSGDWDLALERASGERQASTSFGAREKAVTYLGAGETVAVRACRRSGDGEAARVRFDLHPHVPGPRVVSQLVDVPLRGERDHERLEATGLDVTHAHDDDSAKVVLHGPADAARLAAAGFDAVVVEPDLQAADERRALADLAFARSTRRSALPSGRTAYRELADYGTDLKALVDARPDLVRPITIGRSVEGRPIEGVEIAADVAREDDGRPTFAVLGLHHAREWPSGEMPMELATTLVQDAAQPRIASLLQRVRVVVLPVMNPDGFFVSRSYGTRPDDDDLTVSLAEIVTGTGAYKRKNCRPTTPADAAVPCLVRNGQGVDLNRNYGAFWGGTGSSSNPATQNFRGAGPFSEPESEAFHRFSQTREVVNVVSHHTFTEEGVWLRQYGFCFTSPCDGDDVSPDEAGMKALGDAMGEATGWRSALGWDIGEITGATEDWNYFATGAYGYTPEQRGPNFHPTYANAVVAEYDGTAPGARGGVREALLRAAEQAADPAGHAVLEGRAPAGRVLRLSKRFETATSIEGVVVPDTLGHTTRVREDGTYEWHVNPSTRPLAAAPEAYTLTCQDGSGDVLETRQVVVARGERRTEDLSCTPAPSAAGSAPEPAPPGTTTPAPAGTTTPVPATPKPSRPARPSSAAGLRFAAAADRQRRSTVLRRGLRLRLRCSGACTARLVVRPRGASRRSRAFAVRTVRLERAGRVVLRLRLTPRGRRALARRSRDLVVRLTVPGLPAQTVIAGLAR